MTYHLVRFRRTAADDEVRVLLTDDVYDRWLGCQPQEGYAACERLLSFECDHADVGTIVSLARTRTSDAGPSDVVVEGGQDATAIVLVNRERLFNAMLDRYRKERAVGATVVVAESCADFTGRGVGGDVIDAARHAYNAIVADVRDRAVAYHEKGLKP